MASTAGRKKSIVVSNGLVANNTLLNQAATTSLYQECSRLRARLLTIHGFRQYFDLLDADATTDPVNQLWDLFSFGTPLCYLFDLLPDDQGFSRINHSDFNPEQYEANPDRAKKHAIALFAMQIRSDKVQRVIPNCEPFTITDLSSRSSNDGLVKVVKTVSAIVEQLPPELFELVEDESSGPAPEASKARQRAREIIETERKYVQDLEQMQKYATALAQGNIIDQDTIHLLFPNLNKILNFQRKFLILFEQIAELDWIDQHWGRPFIECEEEFAVYEPYCANYNAASELMMVNVQNLSPLNNLINAQLELPAFLIKPVQRVCKYPLILGDLIKDISAEDSPYPLLDELKAGCEAAKRITDKINEAQRQAENEQTVKNLQMRVDDWKGHHLENFGKLLLDEVFIVTKSDIDREYHVFLFEKIILCCKESIPPANGKKVSKSNSILKKPANGSATFAPTSASSKKTTPLLLKGRIFLGNVTQAVPANTRNSMSSGAPSYPLAVWWRGDDDLEYFTLRCRTEEQMRTWESTINRLIKEAAQRRASERGFRSVANSTNPRLNGYTPGSLAPGYAPPLSAMSTRSRADSAYGQDYANSATSALGPSGYPGSNMFEMNDDDEDNFEEYPPASSGYASGRGTPMGSRRPTTSLPPEQREPSAYGSVRAFTEGADGPVMAQWRNNNGIPSSSNGVLRPVTPRVNSNMSAASDASFGPGVRPQQRPPLRSQLSSTKLRAGYDSAGVEANYRQPPRNPLPPHPATAATNRSRSASQPIAYIPKGAAPPMPSWNSQSSGSISSMNKRGSGSSQSTGDSSDYSPNSSSPITPFGSSESSLGGIRPSRSQNFDNAVNEGPPIKVKVHFHEDIFVIQVPRATEYEDLVEKVGRKIRLCGPRRDDGPLRVKYRDEDGDMVSLGSTEDVQMAFEQFRPGGQVTLFVT